MIGVFPNLKQSYHFTFFRLAGNMINLGMDICFLSRALFISPMVLVEIQIQIFCIRIIIFIELSSRDNIQLDNNSIFVNRECETNRNFLLSDIRAQL